MSPCAPVLSFTVMIPSAGLTEYVCLGGNTGHGIEADLVGFGVNVVNNVALGAAGDGDDRSGENQLIGFHNVLIVYKKV